MWKALFLTMTLAFSSVILSGCSEEQDNQMGQDSELDADPQWSENPYGDEDVEEIENPQSAEEINRNKDDNDLTEPPPYDEEESGLDEATEQGVGQQY